MKKRIHYKLLTIAILSIFSFVQNVFSQAPNWIWAKSAIGDSSDAANSITTDSYGNIYVTGTFTSSVLSFGAISLISAGNEDIFIAKYDANGNVLWAKSAGGTYWERSTSITVDLFDNIYITGYFASDTLYFDTDTLINLYYGSDLFVAKYDSSGNLLWAKRDGIGSSRPNAITSDILGYVYITGCFYSNSIIFGSDTLNNLSVGSNSSDVFTVKYDSAGNVLWARGGGGDYLDEAYSIATDPNDGIYITGQFTSTDLSFDTLVLHNKGLGNSHDIFIVKYDSSGNIIWAKNEGGDDGDIGWSVVTDDFGNFYLAGQFHSPSIIFGSDTLFNFTNYYSNMFLVKYDSIGNAIWAKTSTGNTGGSVASSVTLDSAGNVYTAGDYSGIGINNSISFDSITITSSGGPDIFVVKYANNGNVQWVKSASGNNSEVANSITYDNSGSIYVAGAFMSNPITFDSYIISNSSFGCIGPPCNDIFLGKLNATTGIAVNENSSFNLTIFPNPFTDKINITAESNEPAEISLFDVTARKLLQQTFTSSVTLNTSQLAKGIYVYEVRNKNGVVKKGKIIKD